jgi:hypothetical protein
MKTLCAGVAAISVWLALVSVGSAADSAKLTFKFKNVNVRGAKSTVVLAINNVGTKEL